jgi:two-component system torCAD operon response regulator TorR
VEHRPAHIVIVEDEPVTRAMLAGYLQQAGYRVTEAASGDEMRAALPAELVLLDVELPGDDGFHLARELRSQSDVGIIMLTRRGDDVDRIVGLEVGADDYVVKPPVMRELLVRVKNLLWRTRGARRRADAEARVHRFAGWTLDTSRRILVSPKGKPVPLTAGELKVLTVLAEAHGAPVPRTVLLRALQASVGPPSGTRGAARAEERGHSLDVVVNRLRRKLGEGGYVAPTLILTVHGHGYRIGVTTT